MGITKNDFKRIKNKLRRSGSGSMRKDNAKAKVRKPSVSKISCVQGASEDFVFRGFIGLEMHIKGKTRADIDNVAKGVADGLQGIAYENDRDIVEMYIKRDY